MTQALVVGEKDFFQKSLGDPETIGCPSRKAFWKLGLILKIGNIFGYGYRNLVRRS